MVRLTEVLYVLLLVGVAHACLSVTYVSEKTASIDRTLSKLDNDLNKFLIKFTKAENYLMTSMNKKIKDIAPALNYLKDDLNATADIFENSVRGILNNEPVEACDLFNLDQPIMDILDVVNKCIEKTVINAGQGLRTIGKEAQNFGQNLQYARQKVLECKNAQMSVAQRKECLLKANALANIIVQNLSNRAKSRDNPEDLDLSTDFEECLIEDGVNTIANYMDESFTCLLKDFGLIQLSKDFKTLADDLTKNVRKLADIFCDGVDDIFTELGTMFSDVTEDIAKEFSDLIEEGEDALHDFMTSLNDILKQLLWL